MTPDVAIVGAGLAGAAAALRLGESGARVVLVDRDREAGDKVCGEFMSVEALASLEALGLDPAGLGAVPLEEVRLHAGGRSARVGLPFRAAGLTRRRIDGTLRRLAGARGATLRFGAAVRRLEQGAISLADGDQVAAGAVVLATGKHDLRGWARPALGCSAMVGFKQHLRLGPEARRALGAAVELHLFDGGYAGLLPVESGLANLCLAVSEDRLARAGRTFGGLLGAIAPAGSPLRARLQDATPATTRPLAVSRIPYGFRAWRAPAGPEWLWRIGDQAAVTPSFTGDGMAIALASADLAAGTMAVGAMPGVYLGRLRAAVGGQMTRAGLLDSLLGHERIASAALALGALAPTLVGRIAAATRLG